MKIERQIEMPRPEQPPGEPLSAERVERFRQIYFQIRGARISAATARSLMVEEQRRQAATEQERLAAKKDPINIGICIYRFLGRGNRKPGLN
jgi:hypothetical protein